MSKAEDEFSLRSLVREVSASSTIADPGLLAEEVHSRIPASLRREALRQSLRMFVRQVISEERSRTNVAPIRPGGNGVVKSWKVRAAKAWERSLRDRVHVDGAWKFYGDCTEADLRFAAAERDEHAARNKAKAREYREMARLLSEHGKSRVRDLPAEVLARALGEAA